MTSRLKSTEPLRFATYGLMAMVLWPVPMRRMPSQDCEDWIRFQKLHVPGTELAAEVVDLVQAYMRRNATEALTDGKRNYTIAGNQLAYGDPAVIV